MYINFHFSFSKSINELSFFNMSIYIENDTESHRSTQNSNLLQKAHPTHQNTFLKIPFSQNQHLLKIGHSLQSAFSAHFHGPSLAGLNL